MCSLQQTPVAFSEGDRFQIEDPRCSVCAAVKERGGNQVGSVAAACSVVEGQSRFRPNKRLQLALRPFGERPLIFNQVS
jgi:hypothetical protein